MSGGIVLALTLALTLTLTLSFNLTLSPHPKARAHAWGATDLVIATHPKSGTHFAQLMALLVLYQGELPPKTDLHSLVVLPEFTRTHPASAVSRPLDDPPELHPTHPRVVTTHMPEKHVRYSSLAKFVYVMRDPVASMASGRRMELLLLGPYLTPTLDDFVKWAAAGCVRSGGWLDQVLGVSGRGMLAMALSTHLYKLSLSSARSSAGGACALGPTCF